MIRRGSSRRRMRLPTRVSVLVMVVAMTYAPAFAAAAFTALTMCW